MHIAIKIAKKISHPMPGVDKAIPTTPETRDTSANSPNPIIFNLLSLIYIYPSISTDNINCVVYVMFNCYFALWHFCLGTGYRQDK